VSRAAAAALVLLLALPAGAGEEAPLRPAAARAVEGGLPLPGEAWLGVSLDPRSSPPRIRAVAPGSPADCALLAPGDLLTAIAGVEPPDARTAEWMLRRRVPGESIRLDFLREGIPGSVPAILVRRPGEGAFFRGPRFRLAVVPLALEDLPRGPRPSDADLARMFFSRGAHAGRLPSGRSLHGSVSDYFHDQSAGAFALEGSVLPTVEVPAPRRVFAEQAMGAVPDSLYARAAALLGARDGASALRGYDGIAFLYPGEVASAPRRGLWPHRGTVRLGGRVLPYFVKNLPNGEIDPIGVHCHEFGHLLGLPDQYGIAHRTGVGDFCLMALGHRGGGGSGPDRPFGLCAWCRSILGWTRPVPLDPWTIQDLALAPADAGPGEAFLVPGAEEGECFLLEHRARRGWDASLPGAGLLVWRSGGPEPPGGAGDLPWLDLVEAHAIEAPDASLLHPGAVPFPAEGRDALTEETHPGRAGLLRLSRIRLLSDGTVAFRIGDPAAVGVPGPAGPAPVPDPDGTIPLRDPVTGEVVRLFVGPPESAPARDPSEVEPEEPVSGD
jgi:M6 family metalloprotease-like protein